MVLLMLLVLMSRLLLLSSVELYLVQLWWSSFARVSCAQELLGKLYWISYKSSKTFCSVSS